MRINQVLQRAGTGQLTLDNPPLDLLYRLVESTGWNEDPDLWGPRKGYIVVAPTRVDVQDMSLALASWIGVITKRVDRAAFECRHVSFLLGSGGAPAEYSATITAQSNVNLAAALAFQLAFQPFTVGTVTEPGGTISYNQPVATSRAEMIDYICGLFGPDVTYRVNPDLSIDAGPRAAVFGADPAALVARDYVADAAANGALPGVRGRTIPTTDSEWMTNQVFAIGAYAGPDYLNQTVTSSRVTNRSPIDGSPVPARLPVDEPLAAENQKLLNAAAAKLAQYERPRSEYQVSVAASDRLQNVAEPGSMLWLYDPDALGLDITNHQEFRSVDIFPIEALMTEHEYSVDDEAGIYLLTNNGTQNWEPIHDWVRPDQGDGRVTLNTSTGPLDPAAGEASRFYPNIARRIIGNPVPRGFTVVAVAQGVGFPTYTTNFAEYIANDGIVEWSLKVTFTSGSGVPNQEIHVTIDAAVPGEPPDDQVSIGQFTYTRLSTGVIYNGTVDEVSTDNFRMVSSGNTNGIGRTPNFQVETGDVMTMTGRYLVQ